MKSNLTYIIANLGRFPFLNGLIDSCPYRKHPWISNLGVYMKPFCNQCEALPEYYRGDWWRYDLRLRERPTTAIAM
jgi:hypothetical protein